MVVLGPIGSSDTDALAFHGLDSFQKELDTGFLLGFGLRRIRFLVFLQYWINDSTKITAMKSAGIVASVKRGKIKARVSFVPDEAKGRKLQGKKGW